MKIPKIDQVDYSNADYGFNSGRVQRPKFESEDLQF